MKNNTHFRRVASLALAGAMLAGLLAGCGSKDSGAGLSEYVYVPKYTELPKDVTEINSPTLAGDMVYFTMTGYVHKDGTPATAAEEASMKGAASATDTGTDGADLLQRIVLCGIKKDGTGFAKLADYQQKQIPDSDYAYSAINKIAADAQGNLWVAEEFSKTIYDLPAGFDMKTQDPSDYYKGDERHLYLRKLSNTGKELSNVDLAALTGAQTQTGGSDNDGASVSVNDMRIAKDGNICIADNGMNKVYVLSADGKLLCSLAPENNGYISALVTLKDGSIGAAVSDQNGKTAVRQINAAAKTWGQSTDIDVGVYQTGSGGKQYDFSYNDGNTLYGYDLAAKKNEGIVTWINSDIDGNSVSFAQLLDDGNIFVIAGNSSDVVMQASSTMNAGSSDGSGDPIQFVMLTKTPRKDVKQKTTLTLATMYLDYNVKKEILNFNKKSDSTRIEVKDYSEFNTSDDYTAGITKLSTEMVSGNIPDLLDVSSLPYRQYAAKGLLEDLYPYLDKDSSYKRDALVPSVLKATESNGKLYILPSGFSIVSLAGSAKTLGSDMGWTMAEMQAVLKQHPEADYPFGAYMTRKDILDSLTMLNMDSYIDWQTGKCSFDSDGFKGLLNFAKSFPENTPDASNEDNQKLFDDSAMVRDGRQIMTFATISDFDYYQQLKYQFGGDVVFKGLPSEDKKGNIVMLTGGLAMTSSCKDKDAAWQFIRRVLSDDYQENGSWGLPITQKAYNDKLAKAMKQDYETDENGKQVPTAHGSYSGPDGQQVDYYALTQADADQINKVVASAVRTVSLDQTVTNMIDEEAAYFFKGEKTVDQTAQIVQSRMNVYVNEQK